MSVRGEIAEQLDSLERVSGHPLAFRAEIAVLMESSRVHSLRTAFEELIFLSKFSTRAAAIIRRPGVDPTLTGKLAGELTESFRKIHDLLESLLSPLTPAARESFPSLLRPESQEALESFLVFLSSLARVKDFELDQGRGA